MRLISFEVVKGKLFYPSKNTKNLFWHWLFFLTSKFSLSMVGILTEQFPGLFYTNAFEKLIPKTCSRIACHPTGSVRKTAATVFVVFLSRRLQLPRFSVFCNLWVENLFDLNNSFGPERDLILRQWSLHSSVIFYDNLCWQRKCLSKTKTNVKKFVSRQWTPTVWCCSQYQVCFCWSGRWAYNIINIFAAQCFWYLKWSRLINSFWI